MAILPPLLLRVAASKRMPAKPLLMFEASALKAIDNAPPVAPMRKLVPAMPPSAFTRNMSGALPAP